MVQLDALRSEILRIMGELKENEGGGVAVARVLDRLECDSSAGIKLLADLTNEGLLEVEQRGIFPYYSLVPQPPG